MKLLLIIVASITLATTFTLQAQHRIPHFKHITKDQGLTSNKILCIIQDRIGFMWFGTEDGLTRFDGTNYIAFRNDPKDSNSLMNNYIQTIYEDPFTGNLWIGTLKGLCYFNIRNNKFYSLNKINKTLNYQNIHSIYVDEVKTLWLGTSRGLYACTNGKDKPILVFNNKKDRIQSMVTSIYKDSRNNLWLGTNFGLFFKRYKSAIFQSFKLPVETKISSITEDSRHHIWISSPETGVFEIKLNGEVRQLCMKNGLLKKSNKARAVIEDELGNMYLAIGDGEGLHYLNYKTNKMSIYGYDIYNPHSLNSTGITSIYKDKFKNIWIGTWSNGLNLIDYNKKPFSLHRVNYKSSGLQSNNIRSVFQDQDGDIWIATKDEAYLSKFNPYQGTFTHYRDWLYNNKKGVYSFVLCMADASPGNLLLGTFENGLIIFNKKTKKVTHYKRNVSKSNTLADDKITALFKDRNHTIWVGTARDLQVFNFQKGTFKTVLDSVYTKCILDYSAEEIYFGGSVGLFSYHRKTRNFKRYHYKNSLGTREVLDITGLAVDAKRNLWLSTRGKGLVHFDIRSRKFTSYTIKSGASSNITCGVQVDNKGYIWISTTNGLSKFNPTTGKFRNFYVAEGLQGNEFEKYSNIKTRDGHLLFSGNNGFNYFHPDSISDNPIIPKVIFTDFKIFNKTVEIGTDDSPLTEAISTTKNLTLNHKQSVFTLEFSALNFSSGVYNQYAYKLEPLEQDWNYNGVRNFASYSSLPAGDYTFKVKASNNDGIWNETPTTLSIRVLPAPWRSWWAYILYNSILCGIIYLWLKYKKSKTSLRIAQIEQQKLKELHAIKSQFFTNISHEFKTPLTLILSPLSKLFRLANTDEEKKHLQYINRNALRLQNLINQLMEIKNIESNTLIPKYQKGDIFKHIKDLLSVFEPVINEHQICLILEGKERVYTYFDEDKTEKIFYNIISNAVKFTPKGGSIITSVVYHDNLTSTKTCFDSAYIEVKISNTGSRIDDEHITHIFENHFHIDKPNSLSQAGSGIGLAFTKELVNLLGGTIDVQSDDNCTLFTVRLPDIKILKNDIDIQLITDKKGLAYSEQLIEILKFEKANYNPKFINQKGISVLLVEDNKELRDFLFNVLSKIYKIALATNGIEGLEVARKINPSLIISDINMPGLSGIELCKSIKSDFAYSHIPVILLTASKADTLKLEGLENGADVYIEKPFDLELLKLQIKNILQTRKAQREAFAKKISAEPEKVANNTTDEAFVIKAINIVESNLDNSDFDVESFVKEMGMGRTVLYQKLKGLTDLSINEFILNIRLKKAADLLINTNLTISEVAYNTGFSTLSYFGMCFKKNYQMSPSKFIMLYRKSSRKN